MSKGGFADSIKRDVEEEIERLANLAKIAGIACFFVGWLGGPVSVYLGIKVLRELSEARHNYPDLSVSPSVKSKAVFGIIAGAIMFIVYWVITYLEAMSHSRDTMLP